MKVFLELPRNSGSLQTWPFATSRMFSYSSRRTGYGHEVLLKFPLATFEFSYRLRKRSSSTGSRRPSSAPTLKSLKGSKLRNSSKSHIFPLLLNFPQTVLPTESKVESGMSQSTSGTSVKFSDNGNLRQKSCRLRRRSSSTSPRRPSSVPTLKSPKGQ